MEKIEPRFAKNGNQFWLVTIDSENYSIWDSKMIEELAEGDCVESSFAGSKGYKNIDAISKVEPQTEAGQREGADLNTAQDQQHRIRMSVLDSAADLSASCLLACATACLC